MGPLQATISGVMTILVYTLILFAVFKIFQIATELGEIKELLKDIKRNSDDHALGSYSTIRSPESLMRAVSEATYPPPDLPVGTAETHGNR